MSTQYLINYKDDKSLCDNKTNLLTYIQWNKVTDLGGVKLNTLLIKLTRVTRKIY